MKNQNKLELPNSSNPANEQTLDKYNNKKLRIKDSFCKCSACSITQEFINSYYHNTALIRDTDRLIHIPRVEN